MIPVKHTQSTLSAEEINAEAAEYAQIQQSEIEDYNSMALEDEIRSEFSSIEEAEKKYQAQEELSEETRLLDLEQGAEEARKKFKLNKM